MSMNMKYFTLISNLFLCLYSNGQNIKNDYFTINENKYLKPIKYIIYDSKEHEKIIENEKIYFYIGDERFIFSELKHHRDTCEINILQKIKFSDVKKLNDQEYYFYKRKIEEINYWKNKKTKPPMPLYRIHPFFKIILVEKKFRKIILREVDWLKSY